MSLTLVVGILVAGLTDSRVVPTVGAEGHGSVVSSLAAQNGKLAAGLITARGVVINGVATDGVFEGQIEIGNSVLESACGIASSGDGVYLLGAFPSGNASESDGGAFPSGNASESDGGAFPSGNASESDGGAFPSGNASESDGGAFPSGNASETDGGAFPSGEKTFVGGDVQVFGGVLEGDHIHVANGVIKGQNLRVVGAHVSAGCSR